MRNPSRSEDSLVVDQLEAVPLDLVAGAGGGALREFGVGRKDGYCLWLRLLRRGHVKEANRERIDTLRPNRHHREVFSGSGICR